MARFFLPDIPSPGQRMLISGREAEHIRVLRIRRDEEFILCDGRGTDYTCRLESGSDKEYTVLILSSAPSQGEPNLFVRVYAALPKGDKAETIIQKSVELGAGEVIFFPSSRCVMKLDPRSGEKKLRRWQTIAEEAAKQCGRGIIPKVRLLDKYADAILEAAKADKALYLYENEQDTGFAGALSDIQNMQTISILTGSEGGFSPEEAAFAREHGCITVTLGKRILRCETAPLCALSCVMLCSGNL